MKTHIETILKGFKSYWLPQTLPVAENVFHRFIAGDSIETLSSDYEIPQGKIQWAIRFFILYKARNRHVRALYDDWQEKRFK